MDVILLERIEKLGQMGDVVSVKPGYARNYLLPQTKAVTASENNRAHFETQRTQLEAQNLERKSDAEAVGKKMDGTFVTMVRQAGDAGQLYGSVNARDIASGLLEAGYTITRNQVSLAEPIKAIGLHEVSIALHPEVSVMVTANVARSEAEAEIQEQTGEAVITTEEDTFDDEKTPAESAPEDGIGEEAALETSAEESDDTGDADDAGADDASQEASEED
ncbi:MAG: 50S ribosomal protein L9 [Rhodospirillaceae bacterium TMED167]|nr:50S ribosomal protein L9 [Rhodospirillaceae bacterium]OUW25815.1 MAG: 50S ribosomal protein L9 [Rhodospirillaceae bacterium TMED167]